MRTIIDLSDAQLERLAAWCGQEGISRAEAIRRAVDALVKSAPGGARAAFGLWRRRAADGLAYERALREEWEARPGPPPGRRPRRRR
jgi:hypothetical protein